jgi:signal transduction histidine kinase
MMNLRGRVGGLPIESHPAGGPTAQFRSPNPSPPMLTPQNHPLKLLLFFEWGLLIFAFLAELPPSQRWEERNLILSLACLAGFAILGLRLPERGKFRYLHLGLSALLWTSATFAGRLRMFPLLCVMWVMRNCFIFTERWRNGLTFGILLLAFAAQADRLLVDRLPRFARMNPLRAEMAMERTWTLIVTSSLLLGLVMVFLQYLVDAVLAERRSRKALGLANDRLRRYALKIEEVATLQERNRIAREIHDALGHSLTAMNLHLDAGLRLLQQDPTEAQALLQDAKLLGKQAFQDVRESVATLRADPLQGKSFSEAIAQLTEEFQKVTGIVPHCQIPEPIARELHTSLYRITQEALTNITKYAEATEVSIQLCCEGDRLQLQIQDNGKGFSPDLTPSGFGLQGMRERAEALAGAFCLTTAPGKGCQIQVTFHRSTP